MVAHLTPGQASSSHYFYSNTLHTLSQGVHIHQSSRLNAWLTTPRYRGQLGSPMYLLQRCSPLECVIRNKNSWGLKNLGSVQLSMVWHKVSINIKIKNSKTLQQVPTYLHFLVGPKLLNFFFSDAFRAVFLRLFWLLLIKLLSDRRTGDEPCFFGKNNLVQKFDHGSR